MKKRTKSILFVITILTIVITKQLIVNNLPIMAYAHAKQDDSLMINMANNILKGNWLGEYNEIILTKGVMFPLFLCIANLFGMNYISFQTLFHSIACLIFIYGIKDFIKSKKMLLFIFVCLVFNPVSFATNTLLRVYRNGITISQVLIIFGSYIGLYMNRKDKKKSILFSLLAGFGVATLYHTREDAFWIMPFIITVTIILIGLLIKEERNNVLKKNKTLLSVYILPFIILFATTTAISTINYSHYGIYTHNELNKSEFTRCMKTMYSIKPKEEAFRVSFPEEKIQRMLENSVTLKEIEKELKYTKDVYATYGDNEQNEVQDGWFFWAFREAVADKGYYKKAKLANEFYKKVADELEQAIKDKKLEKQPVMPSSLMPPWKKGNFIRLMQAFYEEIKFVTSYEDVDIYLEESVIGDNYYISELFKKITNNDILTSKQEIQIIGWYANLKEKDIEVEIKDENGNILYKFADLEYRKDISEYLKNTLKLDNDGKVGFNIKISVPKDEKILFSVKKDDILLTEEEIKGKTYTAKDNYILVIDDVYNLQKEFELETKSKQNLLENINSIYKYTGIFFSVVGLIIYLIFDIRMIIGIKNKKYDDINTVLILSGILFSLIVLLFGVAYNEISSCDSISYMYLSGTYPLVIMFWSISICKFIELLKNKIVIIKKK